MRPLIPPHALAASAAMLLAASGCAPAPEAELADQAFIEQANMLADQYQATLKAELVTALTQAGPTGAIGVCHSAAPAIAQSLSEEHGVEVSRIARRNRNSSNAVPAELASLYNELESQPLMDGKPHVVSARIGNRQVFMRAIPMQDQPCAVCHGTNVAPEVKAQIDMLYPDDKAVGFAAGDLRGAFLVSSQTP
jgi:hypothetical protein